MPTALEFRQKAAHCLHEQREIINKATDIEKRSLTNEERLQITKLDDFHDEALKDATMLEKLEKRSLTFAQPIEPKNSDKKGKNGKVLVRRSREDYMKMSDEKRRSTKRYMLEYRSLLRSGRKPAEFRSLRADDDIYGGALIAPMMMSKQFIKAVDDIVFMRGISTVETVKGAMSLGIPVRTARMSDAAWSSELGTPTADTALKFGRRELAPQQLKKEILVSEKFMMHSSRNAEEIVNSELSYTVGITLEKAYLTGTGANQPLGVFTASADGISTGRDIAGGNSSGVILDTGLLDCLYGLKMQYRMSKNLNWIFHRDRIRDIRKLKDGQGRFIWQAGFEKKVEGLLFDIPALSSEYAPTATSSGAYFGVIGDFTFYTCADSQDMIIQRFNELHRRSGQIGFISTTWNDGMPTLEEAFVRLKFA